MTAFKRNQPLAQLQRSLGVAEREVGLLGQTRKRLFAGADSIDAEWVKRVADDAELSERLEAFSGRFSRLQDTVMDKVLPQLLAASGEAVSGAIDNLNRADRLELVERTDDWIALRQLRHRLVHEYMDDAEDFAIVLNQVLQLSTELMRSVERIRDYIATHFHNDATK